MNDLPEQRSNPAFDAAKARKAAADPKRPGQKCAAPPGAFVPVVDRTRCEGKSDCVAVCPYGVFEVGQIDDAEYRRLPVIARLKLFVHGKKTAFTPHADRCQACGFCVVACPERAISLAPAPARE